MPTDHASGSGDPFEVVVLDYHGVCTPSASEFIEVPSLAPLRRQLSPAIVALRRRGSRVVLLSNEFDRGWASSIDGFPEFDHILVGSDNRIFKPDRRAFQRALHVTQYEAANCLVVDDDPTNVEVARSVGCAALHFDTSRAVESWEAVLAAAPVRVC